MTATTTCGPIDPAVLPMILEGRKIWLRWHASFEAGEATEDTHPALAEDRARYEEIAPVVRRSLPVPRRRAIRVRGTFRRAPEGEGIEVLWERTTTDGAR